MGSELRQIVSCTIFNKNGEQFVRCERQIGACTETHIVSRVLETIAKR